MEDRTDGFSDSTDGGRTSHQEGRTEGDLNIGQTSTLGIDPSGETHRSRESGGGTRAGSESRDIDERPDILTMGTSDDILSQ